ncbi:hypothetical protein EYF80_032862 [Liparis tanakae]|uniref:Uncharacterized protein n=1 Tax=Liparis tanakae TaxID=230148 RepID=A0A4Z2GVU2_9TELE|nr:hypothetical protein EYF80_032862 [Liparis tanakae]
MPAQSGRAVVHSELDEGVQEVPVQVVRGNNQEVAEGVECVEELQHQRDLEIRQERSRIIYTMCILDLCPPRPPAHPEALGASSVFRHVADGQHAPHGAVAVLLQVLVDEPVETNAQLRQHRVHVFPVHGLPHVLHLPTDVGADLRAGLPGGERDAWHSANFGDELETV